MKIKNALRIPSVKFGVDVLRGWSGSSYLSNKLVHWSRNTLPNYSSLSIAFLVIAFHNSAFLDDYVFALVTIVGGYTAYILLSASCIINKLIISMPSYFLYVFIVS
jgi:hypothetical protein